MKNKYDTSVVFLYAMGQEHILPQDFRRKIPYPTISTWRKTDYSKYIGHEFRYLFEDSLENAKLSYKYHEMKKGMFSMARTWLTLAPIVKPIIKETKGNKAIQSRILEAIGYMRNYMGVERTLELFGISRTLYHQWVLESRFDCFDSFTALCAKRHPHQLEMKEVERIKKKLLGHELDHWPIVSIAASAFRDKSIVASLCSWYKYARIFGVSRKLVKKDKKTIGLIAKCPNEYLHVDTTYYPLMDGTPVCITFVMDNYSKRILGWHLAEKLSFAVVKEALKNSVKVIMEHPDQSKSILVADGGKENHNKQIDDFLAKLSGHKMKKIRALKDIRFSNSPVEAVHRTLKGRYLRNRKFESVRALNKYLKWAVNDYNMIRPHYRHRPRTPNEVYFNIPLAFDVKKRAKEAVQNRVTRNKLVKCIQCRSLNGSICKENC